MKRIFYYDVLRAVAIIGIVFCHASIPFLSDFPKAGFDYFISTVYDCFRDFSVPIFVMLSGALLIGKKDTFAEFFKKRLSRIFIPFVFWVIIYSVYSAIHITHCLSFTNVIDIFTGSSSSIGTIFWFIWMILVVYIAIFIINRIILTQKDARILNALTVISVLFIVICQLKVIDPYSSRIFYFASFIPYAIIGYGLDNFTTLDKTNTKLLLIATLGISVTLYIFNITHNIIPSNILNNTLPNVNYFTVMPLLISSNIFIFLKYLTKTSDERPTPIKKIITTISKYSFGIYLSHYIILKQIATVKLIIPKPLFGIPITVIIALAISSAIIFMLSKIPRINQISGV